MNTRFSLITAALVSVTILVCGSAGAMDTANAHDTSHTYDMHWTIRVDDVPADAHEATLWIAIPQELPEQAVSGLEVDTNGPWSFVEDPDFHNKVVRVTVPKPASSLSVSLSARVVRRPVQAPEPAMLDAAQRRLYLREEGLVSLSPRIHALADSIAGSNRTRFDYVESTMTYDKQTPGWGHGDSERACDVHRGNCTDFHSLFLSLSRAEGVPARFEMGFPMSLAGETNRKGGYHCWAWFYDDGARAWVPVDISEAKLEPERSDYLFGHLDAERVTFSRGRDVKLPGMMGRPLNYLPCGAYVEVDGKPLGTVVRTLSYSVDGAVGAGG